MVTSRTDGKQTAGLVDELMTEFGAAFDLASEVGDEALGAAVERRLRALSFDKPPEWGGPGEFSQVARTARGPLDFYYRPHLFPGMDPALRLGHHLQFDLLPRELPSASPVRLAAVLESYCHLSGDLLGWRSEGEELFLWIADVSGHGIRSGLAAAVLYFLIGAVEPGLEPAEFARRINRRMIEARNPEDPAALFLTGLWLRFGAGGEVRYASSGHLPALLARASGAVEALASTGPPIGLLPDADFDEGGVDLDPGDTLCLYTDGVSEATDDAGEEIGRDRLAEVLAAGLEPIEQARRIYDAVSAHRDSSQLDDDLSFIVATS